MNLGKCGHPLKTRPCGREPLWPGGKCARHGYGAETLDQWIRGLASSPRVGREMPSIYIGAEAVFEGVEDDGEVYTWTTWCHDNLDTGTVKAIVIRWEVGTRHKVFDRGGRMTVEEAAVMADHLEIMGYPNDRYAAMLRDQVVLGMRAKMQCAGVHADVIAASDRVRTAGVFAVAVDDMLVIPHDSIASLLERLRA